MTSLNLGLHKGQMAIYNSTASEVLAVCGRRFGKTRFNTVSMALDALGFPGEIDPLSPQVILGALPTLAQAKLLLWDPLVNLFSDGPLASTVESINRSTYTIRLKGNKPPIVIRGANDQNGDRLRGLKLYRAYCDEYQDWKAGIRENILLPALADTPGSKSKYTCTPKGKQNVAYLLAQELKTTGGDVFQMPSWVNPSKALQEAIAKARVTMPPRTFRQEFGAEFEDFPGRIYYELSEANLVMDEPGTYDLVVLGHDFGDVNPAIVAIGRSNGTWYVLEGWWPQGGQPVPQPTVDSELVRLARKYDAKVVLCDPSRPSSILGVRALGQAHGLEGLRAARMGYNPIEEGIQQVHSLIYQKRLLFPRNVLNDPRASLNGYHSPKDIWEELSSYHRETDSLGNVLEKVADGQQDHLTDALRYALAAKNPLP